MTKKIVYLVPVFLIIISIITSIIAFVYSEKLENGYIYIDENTVNITVEGEYFAIVGNLGDTSSFISVDSLSTELIITIYDSDRVITREYTIKVKKENTEYSSDIIKEFIGTELISIEDIDDYIFKLDLEDNETYDTVLSKTSNNVDEEEIDLVFINIPEHLLNMKNLNEGIAFTTLVFAAVSGISILVILWVKKDN